jgi:hypothetical protein
MARRGSLAIRFDPAAQWLAAGRVLPGREAQAGRDVARLAEVPGWRGEGGLRGGGQRADAGDRQQPPRDLVLPHPAGGLRIAFGDPLVEMAQAVHWDLQRRARCLGQRVSLRLDQLGQAARVPSPRRDDLAEPGQVTPERVDRRRALPDQQPAPPEDSRRAVLLRAGPPDRTRRPPATGPQMPSGGGHTIRAASATDTLHPLSLIKRKRAHPFSNQSNDMTVCAHVHKPPPAGVPGAPPGRKTRPVPLCTLPRPLKRSARLHPADPDR